MLWGLRRIFRPFTDDRGRRCSLVATWQVDAIDPTPDHWDKLTEIRDDLRFFGGLIIHLPIWGLLAFLGITGWLFWTILILCELPILAACLALARRPFFYPLAHIYQHQVVAAGACASCGYTIANLPTSSDGCIDCPECGAAWRADRRTSPEPHPGIQQRHKLRSAFVSDLRFITRPSNHDHRNHKAVLIAYRPKRTWIGNYGTICRATANDIQNPRSSAGIMIMCFGGAVILLPLTVMSIGTHHYTPWWAYVGFGLIPILILAGFTTGFKDLFVNAEAIERSTLSHGLCPACWEILRGLPPSPDGCTMCPECGSAWRVPEPPPQTPAPLLCRTCKYSLQGLAPLAPGVYTCPECGDVCFASTPVKEHA